LQLNRKPSITLTSDTTTSYAFKGYAPSGFWTGPIGLWGQGGVTAAVGPNLPAGIFGESGEANGVGVWGVSTGTAATSAGVYGRGFSSTAGVYGQSDTGNGIAGRTTGTGSAVFGDNTDSTGYAGNF